MSQRRSNGTQANLPVLSPWNCARQSMLRRSSGEQIAEYTNLSLPLQLSPSPKFPYERPSPLTASESLNWRPLNNGVSDGQPPRRQPVYTPHAMSTTSRLRLNNYPPSILCNTTTEGEGSRNHILGTKAENSLQPDNQTHRQPSVPIERFGPPGNRGDAQAAVGAVPRTQFGSKPTLPTEHTNPPMMANRPHGLRNSPVVPLNRQVLCATRGTPTPQDLNAPVHPFSTTGTTNDRWHQPWQSSSSKSVRSVVHQHSLATLPQDGQYPLPDSLQAHLAARMHIRRLPRQGYDANTVPAVLPLRSTVTTPTTTAEERRTQQQQPLTPPTTTPVATSQRTWQLNGESHRMGATLNYQPLSLIHETLRNQRSHPRSAQEPQAPPSELAPSHDLRAAHPAAPSPTPQQPRSQSAHQDEWTTVYEQHHLPVSTSTVTPADNKQEMPSTLNYYSVYQMHQRTSWLTMDAVVAAATTPRRHSVNAGTSSSPVLEWMEPLPPVVAPQSVVTGTLPSPLSVSRSLQTSPESTADREGDDGILHSEPHRDLPERSQTPPEQELSWYRLAPFFPDLRLDQPNKAIVREVSERLTLQAERESHVRDTPVHSAEDGVTSLPTPLTKAVRSRENSVRAQTSKDVVLAEHWASDQSHEEEEEERAGANKDVLTLPQVNPANTALVTEPVDYLALSVSPATVMDPGESGDAFTFLPQTLVIDDTTVLNATTPRRAQRRRSSRRRSSDSSLQLTKLRPQGLAMAQAIHDTFVSLTILEDQYVLVNEQTEEEVEDTLHLVELSISDRMRSKRYYVPKGVYPDVLPMLRYPEGERLEAFPLTGLGFQSLSAAMWLTRLGPSVMSVEEVLALTGWSVDPRRDKHHPDAGGGEGNGNFSLPNFDSPSVVLQKLDDAIASIVRKAVDGMSDDYSFAVRCARLTDNNNLQLLPPFLWPGAASDPFAEHATNFLLACVTPMARGPREELLAKHRRPWLTLATNSDDGRPRWDLFLGMPPWRYEDAAPETVQAFSAPMARVSYAFVSRARSYNLAGGVGTLLFSILTQQVPETAFFEAMIMLEKLQLALTHSATLPEDQKNDRIASDVAAVTDHAMPDTSRSEAVASSSVVSPATLSSVACMLATFFPTKSRRSLRLIFAALVDDLIEMELLPTPLVFKDATATHLWCRAIVEHLISVSARRDEHMNLHRAETYEETMEELASPTIFGQPMPEAEVDGAVAVEALDRILQTPVPVSTLCMYRGSETLALSAVVPPAMEDVGYNCGYGYKSRMIELVRMQYVTELLSYTMLYQDAIIDAAGTAAFTATVRSVWDALCAVDPAKPTDEVLNYVRHLLMLYLEENHMDITVLDTMFVQSDAGSKPTCDHFVVNVQGLAALCPRILCRRGGREQMRHGFLD